MKNSGSLIKTAVAAMVLTAVVSADESYTVSRGDNLSKIGRKFGVTYEQIMEANNLQHTHIYEGQVLTIPTKGEPTAKPSTGPIRISAPSNQMVDRYRAPGISATETELDEPEVIDLEPETPISRVGMFSGELPIEPLHPDIPAVYVKPKEKRVASHTYPDSSEQIPDSQLPETTVSPFEFSEKKSAVEKAAELIPDIRPQKTVRITSKAGTYMVQPGDSIRSISNQLGVTPWELRTLNKIRFKKIYPGQILKIPSRHTKSRSIQINSR